MGKDHPILKVVQNNKNLAVREVNRSKLWLISQKQQQSVETSMRQFLTTFKKSLVHLVL